jgi:hypothetical protein
MGSLACLGTATATADPNTGNPSDVNILAASLSKGDNLNNCKSAPMTEKGEVAELQCGQSPDSSRPATGADALFSNGADLATTFNNTSKGTTLTAGGGRGGSRQSPTTWSQGSSGQSGQLACMTANNQAAVAWTIDSKNVSAQITASNGDVSSLYKWWQSNG